MNIQNLKYMSSAPPAKRAERLDYVSFRTRIAPMKPAGSDFIESVCSLKKCDKLTKKKLHSQIRQNKNNLLVIQFFNRDT